MPGQARIGEEGKKGRTKFERLLKRERRLGRGNMSVDPPKHEGKVDGPPVFDVSDVTHVNSLLRTELNIPRWVDFVC